MLKAFASFVISMDDGAIDNPNHNERHKSQPPVNHNEDSVTIVNIQHTGLRNYLVQGLAPPLVPVPFWEGFYKLHYQ